MGFFDFALNELNRKKNELLKSRFNLVEQVKSLPDFTKLVVKPQVQQGLQRIQSTPKKEFFLPTSKMGYTRLQQIPKLNVANKIQNPIYRFAANIGQDIFNTPIRTSHAIGRIGQDYAQGTTTAPRLIGNLASIAETPLTFATFGSTAVAKNLLKQGGKGAIKLAVKQGAKTGAKYGGTFGLLQGLEQNREAPNVFAQFLRATPSAVGGAALGGVLGGGLSGGGAVYSKLFKRTPQVEKQLRDSAGRWTVGETPVKPKGMPNAQWKFQLEYNRANNRNPYTPVYASDIQGEAEKRIGLQVRDVNKDKGGLYDVKKVDLFHATDPRTKQIIEQKGFKSVLGPRSKEFGNKTPAVFLSDNPDTAKGFDFFSTKRGEGVLPVKGQNLKVINATSIEDAFAKAKTAKGVDAIRFPEQGGNTYMVLNPKKLSLSQFQGNLVQPKQNLLQNQTFSRANQSRRAGFGERSVTKGTSPFPTSQAISKDFHTSNIPQPSQPLKVKGGLYDAKLEPLANEARKYKSAEEFAKNFKVQGNPDGWTSISGEPFTNSQAHVLVRQVTGKGYRAEAEALYKQARAKGLNDSQAIKSIEAKIIDLQNKATKESQDALKSFWDKATKSVTQPPQPLKVKGIPEASLKQPTVKQPAQVSQIVPETPMQKTISRETLQTKAQESLSRSEASQVAKPLDNIIDDISTDVKNKANILDYLRTPDRVLKKFGLEKESDALRQSYDNYLKELPDEINKITEWSKRAPDSKKIFKALDGQEVQLSPNEQQVVGEIRDYLSQWADRLGLPHDKRISNYITHIFDKDFIKKEFDEDLAKIISDKVAGSVYDPFLQKRLGKLGYIEDAYRALDAYVKRATRKANMDPALEKIKAASETLELSQHKYIKAYIDRVNLRPTDIDNLVDNFVKSTPIGYKLGGRPLTATTRKARQMVYRATLGLNPGTALKNLTQGANTYAKLGEKYTIVGYTKLIKALATGDKELQQVGVLKNDFIQDRALSSTKKFWQRFDKALFLFFEGAEKINRGSAYYGAKAKALAQGKSEKEAIEFGKKIVRDTQFTFGSIDTPAVLQSDINKTLFQFGSFSLKQGEFLSEMVAKKDIAGLLRWTGASLAMVGTVGKLIGMSPKDLIPTLRVGIPPTLQAPWEVGRAVVNAPNKYGGERDTNEKLRDIGKAGLLYVPGATQAKKTFGGLKSFREGVSTTPTGRIRFKVEQTPGNLLKNVLFGEFSTDAGRKYIENLGKSQSEIIYNDIKKLKTPEEQKALWNQYVKEGKITKDNVNDIKKYAKDQSAKISGNEKQIRGLPIKDGSRARAILKELKGKTREEQKKIWDRYVALGIITKEVAQQIKNGKK